MSINRSFSSPKCWK